MLLVDNTYMFTHTISQIVNKDNEILNSSLKYRFSFLKRRCVCPASEEAVSEVAV